MAGMKMVVPLLAIVGTQQIANYFGLPTVARLILQVPLLP